MPWTRVADGQLKTALAQVLGAPWQRCTVVLIVDDHEDFRRSASALLEAEGFAVVGEAADGAAAIQAVERLRPEVVLLDVQLPGSIRTPAATGSHACRDWVAARCDVDVVAAAYERAYRTILSPQTGPRVLAAVSA